MAGILELLIALLWMVKEVKERRWCGEYKCGRAVALIGWVGFNIY
jgi:hypothetical protein